MSIIYAMLLTSLTTWFIMAYFVRLPLGRLGRGQKCHIVIRSGIHHSSLFTVHRIILNVLVRSLSRLVLSHSMTIIAPSIFIVICRYKTTMSSFSNIRSENILCNIVLQYTHDVACRKLAYNKTFELVMYKILLFSFSDTVLLEA